MSDLASLSSSHEHIGDAPDTHAITHHPLNLFAQASRPCLAPSHRIPLSQARNAQYPLKFHREPRLSQTVSPPRPFMREEQAEEVFAGPRWKWARQMGEP